MSMINILYPDINCIYIKVASDIYGYIFKNFYAFGLV